MYRCCIIADPQSKVWEFAEAIYEKLSERSEKFELNPVEIIRFRDGEIKPKIKGNVRRKNCFFVHDSSKRPADWFLELVLINEALRNSSAQEIIDVLPYMKFARQDRKDESRVPISARAVLDVISLYTDAILTIDVHSEQIQGFTGRRFDSLRSSVVFRNYLIERYPEFFEEEWSIMSPDAGGTPRARHFAKKLGLENIVIGNKYRKKAGEVAEYCIIGDVTEKMLIVDDIIDSGNTIVNAVEAVKAKGAREVWVYATHGLFSYNDNEQDPRDKLCEVADKIIVSNSIPQESYKKIEVMPLEDFFAEAIWRINEGISLSELFD